MLIKTKKLLREKVWFPGIDALVARTVKDCLALPIGQPIVNPMPIPLQAWDTVYADFLGPLPGKDLLLVVIDGRTWFPEVVQSIVLLVSLRHMGYPEHLSQTMGHPFTVRNFVDT